jgi:hypothetical protein
MLLSNSLLVFEVALSAAKRLFFLFKMGGTVGGEESQLKRQDNMDHNS